ncbi:polyketide cyclase/dehydrase [Methyloglobulus morosus KoM1]|uniref:Polyketide cyclase/dehydrase n=1 Tax=Methyloglobulus morosus KoM1 TaxID=1116472 RepID=V5C0U6_9GAMM|nr:SRPBCC family protein [Methyloglobulus morosus]ESS72072.1 polyketide cyclase/dehydrase [Methyloglobulus morosus KoM1]
MLNIILMLIPFAIVVVLVLTSRQPDDFKITRSASISAPASAIFPHVNTLQKWNAWSPWAKLDPDSKSTFEGPEEGVGAKMSWAGNNKVGVGSMTITESRPSEFIQFKLEFQKPMQATNTAEFSFNSEGDQTNITWTMTGTNNFMGKVMNLFMNCDKMVGGQFEKGLADLKKVVEGAK